MKPFRPLRGGVLLLTALFSFATHADNTLRIGYQKSSTLLTLIKQRGDLDKTLAAQGGEGQLA
ncbi:hypothetical protein OJE16_07255 [Pantoea tagorei]